MFGRKRHHHHHDDYDEDEMTIEEYEEEVARQAANRQYDSYEEYFDYHPEDIPDGCRECGGPFPNCMDSCSMYDD